jgi:hypothetical protein
LLGGVITRRPVTSEPGQGRLGDFVRVLELKEMPAVGKFDLLVGAAESAGGALRHFGAMQPSRSHKEQ